jgi:hypothetical protein
MNILHRRRSAVTAWLVAAVSLAASGWLQAAPIDDIKTLLEQGKAVEAYALGQRNADQLGTPDFDFLFGIAAIDSGNAAEGVLALERYVVQFPDSTPARAELARGYFVLGDDLRARQEFESLQKQALAPSLAATIERYLDAIRAREGAYRTTARLYVEAGLGHDSNANSGVGSPNVFLPGFGNVTLTSGTRVSSSFTTFGAGGQISTPVAPGLSLFVGANLDGKNNLKGAAEAFDLLSYGASGGATLLRGANLWRATAAYSQIEVDNTRFRRTTGITGEWTRQLDEFQTLTPALQVAEIRYTGGNEIRGADFTGASLTYRRALLHAWQPLVTLTANFAEERNRNNRPDLGRDAWGLRASVAITPAERWAVALGLSAQESRYHATDLTLANDARRDRYYAGDLTVAYTLNRSWSIRGEALVSTNRSNIALYQYDRSLVSVKLRYEFQ